VIFGIITNYDSNSIIVTSKNELEDHLSAVSVEYLVG